MYIITIDGPSSSGKSTVASLVAQKLGIVHINSGEAYRAIAYCMLNNNISTSDNNSIDNTLKNNNFKMEYVNNKQSIYVNDVDVTNCLHTNQINQVVSQYGKNANVIYKASDMARDIAKNLSVVIDGRNLGSFCFPEAQYKFYIDCDALVRAKRRFQEMLDKGSDVNFDEIYSQTLQRDELDKSREVAPLVIPKNAIVIDSTNLTAEQVANQIVNIVLNKQNKII